MILRACVASVKRRYHPTPGRFPRRCGTDFWVFGRSGIAAVEFADECLKPDISVINAEDVLQPHFFNQLILQSQIGAFNASYVNLLNANLEPAEYGLS